MKQDILKSMCEEYQRRFTQQLHDMDLLSDMERLTYRTAPYMSEMNMVRTKIEIGSRSLRDLDRAILALAFEEDEHNITATDPVAG